MSDEMEGLETTNTESTAAQDEVSPEETTETAETVEEVETEAVETAEVEPEPAPVEVADEPEPEIKAEATTPTEEVAPKVRGEADMDYSHTFRELSEGDVVPGVVVHIDKEGVLVDVGTKSEGIIRPHELAPGPYQSAEDVVSVGEKISVYVMETENQDGNLILSKKRADFEKAWERVQAAMEEKKVITAMVTDRVKGGLVVDLGIRGFVPASHVGSGKVKNLEKYIGQSLPLKVIEVDRERRKVVLSHRLATEEEREKKREQTVATLHEGQIREGVVRRITDYGAFVDLGGIDGLLHISEMSWTRINNPAEVVKVGQKIQVAVLKLNLEQGRVSLGMRQILPDPWVDVPLRYRVGEVIEVTISRLVPFGAFVALEGGIEAIIPNSEMSRRRVTRPEDVVSIGETVQAKVIDIKPEERRMTLSIRQIRDDQERDQHESYRQPSRQPVQTESGSGGRMTLGDLVGSQLRELHAGMMAEAEDAAPEEASPAAEPEATAAESVEVEAPAAEEPAVEAAAVEAVEETPEAEAVPEVTEAEAEEATPEAVAEEPAVEEAKETEAEA